MKIKMSIIRELIEDWFGMVGEYSYYGEDGKNEFKKMAMHDNPEAIDDFINFAAQQGAGEYDEIELDSIRPKLEDLIAERAKEELRDYISEIKNKKRNMGQKIQLSESQLRNLIKESVKKAMMNEISSDMIGRASKKFHQKYGGTDFPGPDAKDFPKDEHGNLLYPKDKKPLAQHYRNFNDAFQRAKHDEQMNDPVTGEAMEIWNEVESDVDWEMGDAQWFRDEGGHGPVVGYITLDDGWEFDAEGYGYMQGGSIGDVEVESVSFKSPDGQEGSFRP